MNIVIVGATGRTGSVLKDRALARGHHVTALVRKPDKIKDTHENLNIIKGDVLDAMTVDQIIVAQDAVMVALGTGNDYGASGTLSEGTLNVITAMQQHSVERLVTLLCGFMFLKSYPPMFRTMVMEHEKQLNLMRNSSLDWIAACPPKITDFPPVSRTRTSIGALPKSGTHISRYDVSDFMLDQLESDEFLRKPVGISL
jgi:putative NADH-flavin reductase